MAFFQKYFLALWGEKISIYEFFKISFMKIKLTFILITILICSKGYSQTNFSIKAESGYSIYHFKTVDVDPGPDWKGYNLDGEENGIDFNIIGGVHIKNKLFAGIGMGYLNFEGIDGLSIFSDFEYLPLKTKLTPILNLKIGYTHIWNQYDNGTGTALGELCVGVNYRLNAMFDIYAKSGFTATQQSLLIPIRLGFRFVM